MKNKDNAISNQIEYKLEKKNMNFKINDTVALTFPQDNLFYF